MGRRLTEQEVDERIKDRGIRRVGEYSFTKVPIEWECLVDGHRWFTTPNAIFNGHGCPKCSGSNKLTNEDIDEKIKGLGIRRIGNYAGTLVPIEWECLVDGHRWFTTPNNITKKNGHGCRLCAASKLSKERRNDDSKVNSLCEKVDLIYISGYKNNRTKFNVKCRRCGKEYETSLNSIRGGSGCACVWFKREHEVFELLKEVDFETLTRQKRLQFNNRNYYVDFFLKVNGKKIIVEYNGKQHYEPVEYFGGEKSFVKQKKRDDEIKKYCKERGILLIEIPYWMGLEEKKEVIRGIYDC